MKGLLLLNKPEGLTSFGAVARIKHLSGEKRVGHTGTLDPMATGVLPMFLGRATALSSFLLNADKTYIASAKLGLLTDTLDITGKVIKTKPFSVNAKELQVVLNEFSGEQMQIPPMFSALKRNGVRLYDLARKGEKVEIEPRKIFISKIEIISPLNENGEFSFSVTASKGTYIRSLVRDIGEKLGTVATLTTLKRTETAGFNIRDCVNLNDLTEENIERFILPPDFALKHYDSVSVTEKQAIRFKNGGRLALDRLKISEEKDGKIYKVYYKNEFLGLGYIITESQELAIKCIV